MHDVQCIYGFVLWNCRHISEKLEYYSLKNDLENEMTFLSVHVYCVKFKKKSIRLYIIIQKFEGNISKTLSGIKYKCIYLYA